MPAYFRNIPNFEYVNRTADGRNISDYTTVKNLFKRGKLRDDIFEDLTYFTKYQVVGDDRPDNVAHEVYGDQTLDWLVLLSNNIINVQTEWPLTNLAFSNYLTNKYKTDANLNSVKYYKTIEVRNTLGAIIVPKGVRVPQDYSVEFYDKQLQAYTTATSITEPVTNYDYEVDIEDKKRSIFLLKADYINLILNDMDEIMPYKEGSTQYVSETLKRGENIRLYPS